MTSMWSRPRVRRAREEAYIVSDAVVERNHALVHVLDEDCHGLLQLAVMHIDPLQTAPPGGGGGEIHDDMSQFLYVKRGHGTLAVQDVVAQFKQGDMVIVPKGTLHLIRNTSETQPLKLVTIYGKAPQDKWEHAKDLP
jgi:mannose-6-phosphate isomerase-like protein (cupin superfamily)